MTRDELAAHAKALFDLCFATLSRKGYEYQNNPDETDDSATNAFGNFERVAAQLDVSCEMAAMTYKLKHIDSICRYLKDLVSPVRVERPDLGVTELEFADHFASEPIEGRLIDDIVYTVILHAMITERRKAGK